MTWLPDQAYVDGGWGYVGGEAQSSQVEIHLTDDGPLYQTLRVGLKAYRFDVPVGTYEVELFVADVFGENETLAYQLGHSECMKKIEIVSIFGATDNYWIHWNRGERMGIFRREEGSILFGMKQDTLFWILRNSLVNVF